MKDIFENLLKRPTLCIIAMISAVTAGICKIIKCFTKAK